MKNLALIILSIFIVSTLYANKGKTIDSKIDNVTVFANSAQVFRSGKFNIGIGLTDIIFDSVSPFIAIKSLQAKGMGDFTILDVKYRIQEPEPDPPFSYSLPPQIIRDINLLEDSIAMINFEIQSLNNRRVVLDTEKNLLMNNKLVQGQSDTIPEIKEAMAYLRAEMNDINKELLEILKKEYIFNKEISFKNIRLENLRAYNTSVNKPKPPKKASHQVIVTVMAESEINGSISINYIVSNAGWTPLYDIRAKGIEEPIQLVCKANVYQNSGENWDDVKLKLSTITPNQSHSKPYLSVLYLDYYTAQSVAYSGYQIHRTDDYMLDNAPTAAMSKDMSRDSERPANSSATFTTVVQTMTNIEYEIPLPYTIPSDNETHMVAVKKQEMESEFFHYLLPGIDKQAYLVAKITNWEKFDLLPGMANIYFEGTYVGETALNPNIMVDTMEIALGKDRGVVCERKKESDENRNELVGSNVVKTLEYIITIKNNKIREINLIVEDQITISQNKDITILPKNLGAAEHAETTGMLTWRIKIPANTKKDLKFSYTIEYDKNQTLSNLL